MGSSPHTLNPKPQTLNPNPQTVCRLLLAHNRLTAVPSLEYATALREIDFQANAVEQMPAMAAVYTVLAPPAVERYSPPPSSEKETTSKVLTMAADGC